MEGGLGAYSRQSVLRPLEEMIYELGSEGWCMNSQAKIWRKARGKQQHKSYEQPGVWLKQNEEQRRYQKSETGEIRRIWCSRISSLIYFYFFYRNYRLTPDCSRIYENLSIRHLRGIAYEETHMWLDEMLSGLELQLFLALDPERLPFGNGIQALMIIRMIWELIKNSGSWTLSHTCWIKITVAEAMSLSFCKILLDESDHQPCGDPWHRAWEQGDWCRCDLGYGRGSSFYHNKWERRA